MIHICLVIACNYGLFFGVPRILQAVPQQEKIIRLNLKQCLERAVEKDPEMMAKNADLGIAEAQYLQALSMKILPKFELTNALTVAPGVNIINENLLDLETRNNWRQLGLFNRLEVSFIQPIFSFGRIRGGIEAARKGIEVREHGIKKQRHKITLRITKLYFSRLLSKELLALAEEAMSTVEKAENTLTELLKEGKNPDLNEADLYRLKLFKVELERMKREININNELSISALKSSLDIHEDEKFDISDEFLEARPHETLGIENYFELKEKCRPEIGQMNAALAAQKKLSDVSFSFYYPQIFIGGGTTLSFTPIRDDINNPYLKDPFNYKSVFVYLGISMPLNFRQTRARVIQAKHELNKIEAQNTAIQKAINLEVQKAYLKHLEAKKNMEEFQKALTISREWKMTEQISFDLDGMNAKDLVDAVQAYLKTKASVFQAIFEYNVSIAELEYVTGTLGNH
ncbi:MAG: TolC family protein [Candidatus Aminicenantes bacterium]|nr:TolC family protein [Candidatus Aminicenantes bacterium]